MVGPWKASERMMDMEMSQQKRKRIVNIVDSELEKDRQETSAAAGASQPAQSYGCAISAALSQPARGGGAPRNRNAWNLNF